MDSFDPLLQDWRVDTTVDGKYRHHKLQSGPECWKEVRDLGRGTYGFVCQELCLSGRSKNSMRAVKHVTKRHMLSDKARRELNALVTFSNSEFPEYRNHFVQFLGWFDDASFLYIIMEFFEHGDLQKQMTNYGTFPDIEAALITAQVAQALQYMHEKGFIHRDIKPLNILVSRPGPYWHVKVADFGDAKNTDDSVARTSAGTPAYMAPEVQSSNPYTAAVDIWSLGAVAYYMRTGFAPFTNSSNLAMKNSDTFCKDFVMRAMAEVPEQRLTIGQVLAHDWLQIDYAQLGDPQRGETTTNAKDEQTPLTWLPDASWWSDRQSQPRTPSASIIGPTITPKPSVISPHLGQHRYGQESNSKNEVGSIQRKEVGNNRERIVAQSHGSPMGTIGRHSEARTKSVEPKQSHLSQTPHKSAEPRYPRKLETRLNPFSTACDRVASGRLIRESDGQNSDRPAKYARKLTESSTADFMSNAQQFVHSYYQTFDTNLNGLRSFYRDQSMLTFETSSVQGVQGIIEKLSSLPFQKFKHQLSTFDAQPSHGNAITVLLTGALLVDEEQRPMNYTQLFELKLENGSYCILNDVFRLLHHYTAS